MLAQHRTLSILAVILLLLVPALAAESPAPTYRIVVDVSADPELQLRTIRQAELIVDAFERKTGSAYLTVGERGIEELRVLGFEPIVVEDVTSTPENMEALSDYLDQSESDAAVTRIANDYPAIAQRLEYGYTTAEGRVISGLKISDDVGDDEAEPRIFFVSQHHAREVMTPEVLIDFADMLTQNYGLDPEITEWVDSYQIYIFPCHNPDGTHHVFTANSNWRKNRRDNGDGSFGVDPNRNYPYAWGPDGCNGSSGSTSSDTYRGPSAGSEPATQGITELTQAIDPSISLTYHTYGELVLMPFGCQPQLPDDPDLKAHREVGSSLAASVENDAGNGWYEMGTPYETLYSVDGGSDDWLHARAGTVAFTIEMNTGSQGFQPDYDTWRDDTVARNIEGLEYLMRRMGGSAIRGHVRDACSGAGLVAEVGIAEQTFTLDQTPRTSLPDTGFFHRIVEPGEYTWYADVNGYTRQDWPVAVRFDNAVQDVWLVPDGSFDVALRELLVDDGGGDADGQLDPGEEIGLTPRVLAGGGEVTGLVATLTTTDPYVEILDDTASFATIPAGSDAEAVDGFQVRVFEDAPDGHVAEVTVTYSAVETLCRPDDATTLRITRGFPADPFEAETFDADPAWTIDGPSGGWEFGATDPGAGGTSGPTDPRTGDFVYGTNLAGSYGTGAGEFTLTSTPFDLQGLRDAELRFWRYLNNEPAYDLAKVEASVDGETWIELWRGFGRDTRWEDMRYDLPVEFDDAEQAWVRFSLRQDGGGSRSGFYLDDVRFVGENALTAGGKLKYDSHVARELGPEYSNSDGGVDPDETIELEVSIRSSRTEEANEVSAVLATEAPDVTIHNAVALFPDVPAGGLATTLAPHFTITVGPRCAERIPFELEVRAADGSSTTSRFVVEVGTITEGTLFVDDMEQDRGWIASGDDQGAWQLGDPSGNTYENELTNPEDDHTADPGVSAYATQNVPPPSYVPPTFAEVDGQVVLTSPRLEARAYDTLELSYWRWFYTGAGPGPDTYRIEVSSDGGQSWRLVDEVGTKANEWIEERHELSTITEFSDDFYVRAVVTDVNGESIVEAGLDDVALAGTLFECETFGPQTFDPPNPVGNTLLVFRRGFDVELQWTAPDEDPEHGPATFYEVDRSEQADGSFAMIGKPTATRYFDVGAAGPSSKATFFYLVEAENAGGTP